MSYLGYPVAPWSTSARGAWVIPLMRLIPTTTMNISTRSACSGTSGFYERPFFGAEDACRPTTLRLLFLRPFIPLFVRNFSLYWRNKMVDWASIQALKDLRHTVQVMDRASKKIFAAKKAALKGDPADTFITDSPLVQSDGQDIMTIMRACLNLRCID